MARLPEMLAVLSGPGQLFEVVEDTMHGRPIRTYANRPRNLRELFGFRFVHGEREYVVQGERRLTFGEVFDRALRLASTLHEDFGLGRGDRIGVIGANHPDWVVSFWTVVALQGIAVPFNAWWTSEELGYGLDDSGTSFLFADARRAAVAVEAGFDPDRIAVWDEGGPPGTVSLDDLVGPTLLTDDRIPAVDEDEVAAIFYTSGTTGNPKGSANTHRNIITNLLNAGIFTTAVKMLDDTWEDTGEPDVNLCVIPLFHATAAFTYLIPYVFSGAKLVFLPPGRFDPEVAAATIERERVTTFGGVPTVVARMLDAGVHLTHDLSSVQTIGYGGAPAAPHLLERIAEAFPGLAERVAQGYGLTETSAITTVNAGADYRDKPDSVGPPAPVCDLRIVDADGADLPPGTPGEILIRGPNVIPGYWNRPDADERAFLDGFLRTGDIGFLDEDGFLHVTDRVKDMVIRGGENVYCVEVEAALESHPAVREAAVVGVPHPEWGEEVKAVVVVAEDADVDDEELRRHVASRLAPFKVPTHWEFRTELLPRNPTGKVLKRALREGRVFAVGDDTDSAL